MERMSFLKNLTAVCEIRDLYRGLELDSHRAGRLPLGFL